ncbi:MAG: capsular polysaccharide synthesis protein [Bacteroidales bacterium]|nr:capsular polysaccharide synthesis protein [Bacteroidales bacterium]
MKRLVPTGVWSVLREKRIVAQHTKVAKLCEDLIENNTDLHLASEVRPKIDLGSQKIIWQYWAQGFDNLPTVVQDCLASVDRFHGEYEVIRLSDSNLGDYIDIPDYIGQKRDKMSVAHFSDILRVLLLNAYGGIWMDATIMLTGPVPKEYLQYDFFAFQRDQDEPNKKYWRNTYAYYFGWAKGFRVNLLSSFISSARGAEIVSSLSDFILAWWKTQDYLPDYFFLHILFDVMVKGDWCKYNCPIESDCLPHYLQQYRNDPAFTLMPVDRITKEISIHKLTYK